MSEPTIRLVRLREVALPVEAGLAPTEPLRRAVAERLGIAPTGLPPVRVARRALDARHRALRYVFTIELGLPADVAERLIGQGVAEAVRPIERYRYRLPAPPDGPRPVVVGTGPAGLFAALALAEAGWPPLLLERGRPVDERGHDVSRLYAHGELDTDSNVCFGEGGAGTYSDGKLYTRVNDPRVELIMTKLVEMGADPDILVDHRPHLGTDRLVALLRNMRRHLEGLGSVFRFRAAVQDFSVAAGQLTGLVLRDGERLDATRVVLGTGHSARDIWQRLIDRGLPLEVRPFAVGFRVEHPQPLIDRLRYGAIANKGILPAADYRLTYNEKGDGGRGVYSFCMCPGGVVVPTPTEQEELCLNGMSHASRSGRFANSALVVTVTPEDYAAAGHTGVLAGVDFQRQAERAAYAAGGGSFVAPAARLSDYAAGKPSSALPKSSYRRGLWPADLEAIYPAAVHAALRRALGAFNDKMRGFITEEAVLLGAETRTSSPVRVPRREDLQAVGALGLYPAGEGVGYGGGIISSAVDGLRAAEAMLEAAGAVRETLPAA